MKKNTLARALIAFHPSERMPHDLGGALEPGVVHLANTSRFIQGNLNVALTAFAVGYKDPANLEQYLEFLAPAVPVPRRFSFRKAVNAEAFYSEVDDIRAIGADFKPVRYSSDEVEAKTVNKGLVVCLDLDEIGEDGLAARQQLEVQRLMKRLLRNDIRRAVTLHTNTGTNTNVTWSTAAGKDPDADITAGLILAADDSGLRPNRIGYGETAWDKRALAHRAQATAGGFASASLTKDQLASLLGVEGIEIISARYQSTATAKTQLVGNKVFAFYAEAGQSPDDPSNIKRFVTPAGGQTFRVYVTEGPNPKLIYITVEHYSNLIATSTVGWRQWTVS